MEQYQAQTTETHLFDDTRYHFVQASRGKRFLNYIIDRIVFSVLMYGVTHTLTILNLRISIDVNGNTTIFFLFSLLFNSLCYALFISFIEFVLKGKTPGKIFTGTRALKEDGNPLTPQALFLRNFCRIIPFNAFSAFAGPVCHPWHDRLSKTFVIDERESRLYIR